MFHVPNHYRIKDGIVASSDMNGNNGAFGFHRTLKSFKNKEVEIRCIASDGGGWEHVSVSLGRYDTPTWEIMCIVKDMFWDEEDVVVQYHPKKSEYVNNHEYCLHLWRNITEEMPTPPSYMVGWRKEGGMPNG